MIQECSHEPMSRILHFGKNQTASIVLKIGMDPFDDAPNRLPVSDLTRNQIFLVKNQIIIQISHGIEDSNGILR